MYAKEVVVTNASGLHARPAADLVKFCASFSCKLTITGGRGPVDPKSIFSMMSAAIKPGTTLTVTGEGEDEETAVEAVCAFIAALEE
ncbi:HPr family phosphocarrier protein [Pseudoflavonifractor phocaeensis]|uniref:HPr family phosphocarrier protein n=1 Tax=Pseudoflavonifractor phocaeensis TaxID=1870988 RepID=UPI001958D504|nr:HPr family phosphocarrier protein [Pseudoflavonifractor phocaeensis]MBM6870648.1 HPr family phosphocarrier protein [Pseudoflavonifractor phocaeensis]MBM6937176.1 HPr family phosphocarrier protein [Pseudoflavonifractor phocaeensis]